MNVLPTALELLADSTVTRRAGAAPSAQRQPRTMARKRSAQLPLALPLGRRAESRSRSLSDTAPFAPPPALDDVAPAAPLPAGPAGRHRPRWPESQSRRVRVLPESAFSGRDDGSGEGGCDDSGVRKTDNAKQGGERTVALRNDKRGGCLISPHS